MRIGNGDDMAARYSKPCKNCQRVLSEYNFKRIEFTTDNEAEIGRL
nr:MAG TPA: cytidine deaminase [Caudoviricetes sp.]DAT07192.1 MAG TPA: cytidine deaminase [Caudoviricetes sp.]